MFVAEVPTWLIRMTAFVWGAIWGSFFNVAIYRWPREMSVVSPPSHCPACGAPVEAWRNVPILGYLLLRGRAACCGAPLSPRYAVVELLGATLCLALAQVLMVEAPPGTLLARAALETLVYFAFVGGLVVATFVDLEWMEIPDEVSLPGTALGLLTAPFRSFPGAVDAAIGAGAGYLGIQITFVWVYERLTGRRGMGEGDAKLLMMIGAFLGWKGAIFALVAGAVQGLVVSVFAVVTGRQVTPVPPARDDHLAASEPGGAEVPSRGEGEVESDGEDLPLEGDAEETSTLGLKVPFGPFLALGAIEFLFVGDAVLRWWLGLGAAG